MCALLNGGGYAEKVAVPATQVLPIPPGVSLEDAASLPEVACTVWSTVFMISRLSAGETFLVITQPNLFSDFDHLVELALASVLHLLALWYFNNYVTIFL